MRAFPIHTIDSAPEGSREILRTVQKTVEMIPNLAAGMAGAPTLVRAFFGVREIYAQGTLSEAEVQVLSVANALENDCGWCVAFHSFVAEKAGVPHAAIDALRQGADPDEPRFRALAQLTRDLIQNRGAATPAVLEGFYDAGFTPPQALEVVLGIAFSTMANYAQHLIQAPLDEVLKPHGWSRTGARAREEPVSRAG